MAQQSSQQQWSLLYYRKKAQFNQYVQFKAKSFQYQKLLGNLNYLANDDQQTQRKQMKQLLVSLNETMDDMRNIFSQMHQQMKFLKLQNLITLIQSFEQLITEVHHFTIENFKRRLQYGHKDKSKQQQMGMDTCRKCLGSINQLNLKRLYDEITTTESNQDEQTTKMTRQQRRKMISQLDQYDILLAEKENYLRKVNSLLEMKGRVGELSNHDKTYNFLSEYLSKIQKIQQRRNKSYNKADPNLQQDRTWQQQSYKHILQYIKRVLFEHFVNQCSGPVKKMFQKINIDKLFKSFGDQQHEEHTNPKQSSMQNHQTQTNAIPQMQQLKNVEKKLDFKFREIALLKTNKQELEKKYIVCLDQNRKLESDMFEVKKERKWFESEMTIAQENLKKLTERYHQAVKNYEEDQQRTIQRYINERERLVRASKTMEADFVTLEEEHKKCERMRNKAKEYETVDTQTVEEQFVDQIQDKDNDGFLKIETSHMKRRKSKINKMLSTPFGERRNSPFSKSSDKSSPPIFDALSQDTIIQQDDNSNITKTKLSQQSHKIDFTIESSLCGSQDEMQQDSIQQGNSMGNIKKRNSMKKFNRGRSSEEYDNFLNFQRTMTGGDQIRTYQDGNSNNRCIKISINAFKKQHSNMNNTGNQLEQVTQQGSSQNSPNRLSKFGGNRFTQGNEDSPWMKNSLGYNVTSPELFASMKMKKTSENKNIGFMVSERLYSRKKRKQSKQQPFQRVIENGKQKFYIKKISSESTNYKLQKQRMKQISQILKPYVYNNHNLGPSPPKVNESSSKPDLKSIRQRLNWMGNKRLSKDRKSYKSLNKSQVNNEKFQSAEEIKMDIPNETLKNVGQEVVNVQQIIESEYAYLKAVGFIDFLMKIGKDNKKMMTTIHNIQHEVKEKFKSPQELDLQLFGGRKEAENYTKGRSFWMLDEMKDNIMIYNKNDGLSTKVQKYFTLLKRANPELYGILIVFLTDPIFAVFGQKTPKNQMQLHRSDESNFVRDLFNQLQKYHKIKHNTCTHIIDFLEKIGFYKYTYF